jgi:hypothetical protein
MYVIINNIYDQKLMKYPYTDKLQIEETVLRGN